ncbi:MAG: glycosyltransferase family 9 protein [Deltaproteobacteria bacterium]|nr:glycosyltransferase family 9 protein [Deltaproteobacteria bacterium]
MNDEIQESIADVYRKRQSGEALSRQEYCLLLLDTLSDPRPFMSPHWRGRYGGVRFWTRPAPKETPKRILVLQWPSALGDAAMCSEFFSGLRTRYPSAEISCLTGRAGAEMHRINPVIDVVIENPLDRLLGDVFQGRDIRTQPVFDEVERTALVLADHAWDLLINLQVVPVSAALARLIRPLETIGMTLGDDGVPEILGNVWSAYLFGVSGNLLRDHNTIHRREIFCRMIDCSTATTPPFRPRISNQAVGRVQALFDAHVIEDTDFVVGLAPLSTWPSKIWHRYHDLADRLAKDLGAKVILFGAGHEEKALRDIAKKARSRVVVAAGLPIEALMAALCGCDLVIGNDTGPLHIACALRKKVVGIYGPTDIYEVGPLGEDWVALQWQCCKECFSPECHKDMTCMKAVGVDDVMRAVVTLLTEKPEIRNSRTSPQVRVWTSGTGDEKKKDAQEVACRLYFEHVADSGAFEVQKTIGSWDADTESTETVLAACLEFKHMLEDLIRSRAGGQQSDIDGLLQLTVGRAAVLRVIRQGSWKNYCAKILEDVKRLCLILEQELIDRRKEMRETVPGPLMRRGSLPGVAELLDGGKALGRQGVLR